MTEETQEPRKEEISLEYKVEFEGGLRPSVIVYGFDPEKGVGYEAKALIGVIIGAGNKVNIGSKEVSVASHVSQYVTMAVEEYEYPSQEDKSFVDFEQYIIESAREMGVNCIKVQNPEHTTPAIKRHTELYYQQFEELGERFKELFNEFVQEHPWLINYGALLDKGE
ncbi:hypothetical protein GOV06_02745 [Candidatus Woesearchaeota archaeon]|nr:hypothetical protein [Candidatus Woesearchaeota archaeon]